MMEKGGNEIERNEMKNDNNQLSMEIEMMINREIVD